MPRTGGKVSVRKAASSDRPSAGVEAARSGMSKQKKLGRSATVGRGVKPKKEGITSYSEDSVGLQISPKVVIIISLLYLGTVVILHIINKFRSSDK